MTEFTWFQAHQTLVVGGIGFLGVLCTLWFNAYQTRKQRQNELHHERQTLRAALIQELKINREAMAQNAELIKGSTDDPSEAGGYFLPTDPMHDVYLAFVDRVGVLSSDEVSKVMNAYLMLRTYHTKLFLIGVPANTSKSHVEVAAEFGPTLFGMQENLIGPLDDAITALEQARDAH